MYKEEARRDATRIRIYNSVLTAIYNRVKAVARIPGNEKSLWYIVPEFIPGTPRFDMGDAILYIVWNLRNSGYTVSYTHPNLLFISWKSHDDYYRSVDSPWSQVLQAAKTQVVVAKETTHSPILKPQITTALEIQKRKTPLKKTVEFKPTNEMIPNLQLTTNPSIVTSMYSAQPPARLPGQLTDKHISFV
ncbi:MAG: hypothetical protein EBT07_03020 [Actinobacteria bacterium]|nr:hypothetical protein [Actinomycetota bacterium]